jgi:16S rRNA G966 N2-methylase RsmD
LTGLFAFHGAGVAGHEAVATEHSFVFSVDFDKSASDTEAERFSLSFIATTVEINVDVIFFYYIES